MRTSKTTRVDHGSESLTMDNIETVLFYLQLREHMPAITEPQNVEVYEDINFNEMRRYKIEAVNIEVARAKDSGESAFDCILSLAHEETKQINKIALHPASPIICETLYEKNDLHLNDVYIHDSDLQTSLANGTLLNKSTEYLISFLDTY